MTPQREERVDLVAPADNSFDPVARPEYYAGSKIECIDYILDKGLDFPLGNAVKYITRAGKKHSSELSDTEKAIQDLEKAKVYIDFEIAHLKGEK